jgi:ribosome-associated protein
MEIPRERLTIRFARSGGPGGQNVNKVETKAEVRFLLAEADWLPPWVRERMKQLFGGRLTREGEVIISSSRFRSQAQNLDDCLQKLRAMIEAAGRKSRRRIATAPTRASRERRAQAKRSRGARKRERGWRARSDEG